MENGQIWCYKINDKSWTLLKTFQSEQIYNIIENNNNIYKFKNHLWNTEAHFLKNVIYNITIDNVESIYAGNDIGNVYKISNQKITKISNINNISIIDIKVNNNNLYILSENGQLYKMNI